MPSSSEFPQVLYDYWHASDEELSTAIADGKLDELNVSSLLKAYLDVQLAGSTAHQAHSPPSLKSVVLGTIIAELKASGDLPATVTHIARTLDSVTYRLLLSDARLPYRILRAFLRLIPAEIPDCRSITGQALVDIDEAIHANNDYLRCIDPHIPDDACLVTVDDLCSILDMPRRGAPQNLPRKPPGSGGSGIINMRRNSETQLLTSKADYTKAFNLWTNYVLGSLDWTNVIVAGEFPLALLLAQEVPSWKPIHLYVYGIDAEEAAAKMNDIHNIWLANLPRRHGPKLVSKTANSLILLADHTTRPVHINFKLYGSPTQVLLDQEPDPYAIGYNGSYVHMLPRCARAIETGYFYPKQQPVIESELPELAHDFHDMALEDYTGDIDSHNQQLFGYLQYAICEELQIPLQRIGYRNYLTRRIRRQVHGPDLKTVERMQITIPLMIPPELERHIMECLDLDNGDPPSWCKYRPLISVHDSTKHDPTTAQLPSLLPITSERGKLVYWVLSNESIWSGRDMRQNAVFEVLRCLFSWFMHVSSGWNRSYRMDSPECLIWTVNYLRKKLAIVAGALIPSSQTAQAPNDGASSHAKVYISTLFNPPFSMESDSEDDSDEE